MPAMESYTHLAEGTIRPSRFVKAGSGDFSALEADANEAVVGVSQEGTADPPIPGVTPVAASSGDHLKVYGKGAECLLELGSGGITFGAYLKSDADGKGVAAATTGTTKQQLGARALEGGAEGDLIRVIVHIEGVFPALA